MFDSADPLLAPLAVTTRWLFFLSIVGMGGAAAFRVWVLPATEDTQSSGVTQAARHSVRQVALAFGLLSLLLLPIRLDGQSRAFFLDDAWVPENLLLILVGTPWGTAWLISLAATVVFLAAVAMASAGSPARERALWWVAAVAAAVMGLVPAVSGHAWGVPLRALAVTMDTLHVLAGAVWLGGLGTLVVAAFPRWSGADAAEPADAPLSRGVDAFSRIALVAVVTLVATGIVSAWLHLGGAATTAEGGGEVGIGRLALLFSSAWGRALLVKLVVAACAFCLGAYNWKVLRPALHARSAPGGVSQAAAFEWLTGLLVLLATAILVVMHLPA